MIWLAVMNSTQFSIRIPPELDQRIKEYAQQNGITKSKVMQDALNHYLGFSSNLPLSHLLFQIEKRLAAVETAIEKIAPEL